MKVIDLHHLYVFYTKVGLHNNNVRLEYIFIKKNRNFSFNFLSNLRMKMVKDPIKMPKNYCHFMLTLQNQEKAFLS